MTNGSILIAEDDESLRSFYAEYLRLFCDVVFEASNGIEAFEIYQKKLPDIIISDINMPKLDGLALIKKIRQNDAQTRIIILSAYAEQEMLLQAVKLHLIDYLIKPVRGEILKELVQSILRSIQREKNHIAISSDLYWDKSTKQLYKMKILVKLQESERRLLDILISSKNANVSNEAIYQYVFYEKHEEEFSINAITSLLKRIRKKLPDNVIVTNYGRGYSLNLS